jgi:hypothetical protein
VQVLVSFNFQGDIFAFGQIHIQSPAGIDPDKIIGDLSVLGNDITVALHPVEHAGAHTED